MTRHKYLTDRNAREEIPRMLPIRMDRKHRGWENLHCEGFGKLVSECGVNPPVRAVIPVKRRLHF